MALSKGAGHSLDGKNDGWSNFAIEINGFFNQPFVVTGH
ncbi:hypothetical protein BURPS668_2132 [Burkholderia pseudomallei 668]|nr:hypothetical protein BURPS668_2132 [Burkholderia pseudomallei 668]